MQVIRSKVRPPTRSGEVVSRPRLTERIGELLDRFGVVWVLGTAGAGKTTAVVDALADRPLAWLTLDSTETAPGRLLAHLEAALAEVVPGLPSAATDALAAQIGHVEAAGLLAEAAGERELTLVVDEVERLANADEAKAALSAFIRYAPPALRMVLISRRVVPLTLGSAREVGGVGHLTEAELAFSVDEAAHALEAVGHAPADAEAAVLATGGWVAGVLFEAWRSPSHTPGAGGEADPLSGYLSSEIMDGLGEPEREFLIATSLLEDVTAERAEALGQPRAAETLAALRTHRLPVAFSADGMRCHARFREYLQLRLRGRDAAAVRELRARHGALLAAEGRDDDAVGEFLAARDADAAARAAQRAIYGVLRRRDFAVAARWLEELPRDAIDGSEPLTYAELVVAMENEEFVAGQAPADRLLVMSRSRGLDASTAGAIAMCYLHVDRLDEAYQVVNELDPGPERDAWQFQIGVAMADDPHHYRDRPGESFAFHGFLARLDLYQGRLQEVLEPRTKPWAAARSSRIEALRAVGRFDEALALLRESSSSGWTASRVRQYGEIMIDLNRSNEAHAAARQGRELIARSGALSAMLHYLFEATLALRLRRDTAAAAEALARVESYPTARRRLRTLEQLELWHGVIGLLDEDASAAAEHLRRAVDLMLEWDRLLLLPTAAVYLAEAEWRLGDEAAADAAADRAVWAARRQGSNHLLMQALREFPSVASRRLDAEAGTDSAWHEIGRTLMSERLLTSAGLAPHVHVREFGTPAIVVDGREVQPKLTRSVELLAYLAAHDGPATRGELLDDLFGGRADGSARSYLRQAVNRLRDALPEDAPLAVDADQVAWTDEHLSSESIRFLSNTQQALHVHGRARLDALVRALEAVDGEYLPGARSHWADKRREELREAANDARLAAADAAFGLGELEQADDLVQRVLRDDIYRESAWRLSMRIAGALGHDDRVIARFRSCQAALAELATEPAASTRRLLEQLRR